MLIGLHSNSKSVEERVEVASRLAEHIDGTTRIYNPTNLEKYTEALRAYKPRNENLIFTSTHYAWSNKIPEAEWRAFELFFDRKSGSMWGDRPLRSYLTHVADYEEDPLQIVRTAEYNRARWLLVNKLCPAYFGRVSSDPHTIIVGFAPSVKVSRYAGFLLANLPDGKTREKPSWWTGVGFITTNKKALDAIDWFSSSNVLTVGDKAHEFLEQEGIEHGATPDVGKVITDVTKPNIAYGAFIRETARMGKSQDVRDWRN